jgi:hypothetical protein
MRVRWPVCGTEGVSRSETISPRSTCGVTTTLPTLGSCVVALGANVAVLILGVKWLRQNRRRTTSARRKRALAKCRDHLFPMSPRGAGSPAAIKAPGDLRRSLSRARHIRLFQLIP